MTFKHDPSGPADTGASRGEPVILVIDDDADVRWATVRILQEAGFQVFEGGTAAEAIELTRRHRPALVLLDVILPDGNGVDVARELKRDPALGDVFVILVSGKRTDPQDQADGLSKGLADGYIARPIGKVELLARVDALLRAQASQAALRESETQFRELFDGAPVAYHELDREGVIRRVNLAECVLLGYQAGEMLGRPHWAFILEADRQASREAVRRKLAGEQPLEPVQRRFVRRDGGELWLEIHDSLVRNAAGETIGIRTALLDITARKLAEAYREMDRRVLRILTGPGDFQAAIRRVLATVKTLAGCDAIGIRLQDGDDFPYFAQEGFPEDFLLRENSLIERGAAGEVCRDEDGNVRLECTCGLVISGKTVAGSSLFTLGGSFWTNNATPLPDLPPAEDPRLNPRKQCMHLGYASVALVPIWDKDRIVGLIQLNDRRKGRFTLDSIELLEGIASHIGEALMRKRAEEATRKATEALARAEQHYRLIFNSVSDAVFVFTVSEDGVPGPFLEVNDSACRSLGYTREELLAMRLFDIVDPESNPDLRDLLRELRAKGRVLYEVIEAAKDGRRIPVEVVTHLVDLGGWPTLISSVRDITDRKESEKRYRDIFEGAVEGIHRTSFAGRCEAANPAAARMMGYDSAEEFASAITDSAHQVWVDPAERAHFLKLLEQHGVVRGYECRFKRKDGSVIWVSVNGRRADGNDGRPLYNDGFIEDITERKRAEEEKARLEAQFHQAQKMESIGRLAGGVAHDFNNLLTVINGYSRMLLSGLSGEGPLQNGLTEIHKAGERAAALTRQLLAFSRKQVLEPRRLNINRVVEEMRPMLERLVGEDVEVGVSLHPEGGTIYADPHQLEQVVMNLAVNSRDAMPGGGKLLIETARAGRYIMLAVSDNGAGMDHRTKERIFEPFFTTKAVGQGTGLGLAMVQGIVAQSGGYIEVSSEEGRGTTFRIYLPAAAGGAADAVMPSPARPLGGKETVLVVEDQAEVRRYAVAVLRGFGYRVIPVESACEALLVCDREPVDLLLTDVVMPDINGWELATRLGKLQPRIRMLFMSGYTDDAIAHHGVLEEGANFIQKPFGPDELAEKVRAVLG
jgi:PAS domain S-box-containing protein